MTRHWLYLWLFMIWLAAVSGQGTTLPSGDTVDAISSTSGDDPQNQMTISAIAEESRDTTGAVSEVSAEIGGNPESETPFNAHPEQAEVEGWSTTESSASPESESESVR
ncbi:hypothetical protein LSH36_681g02050 [Paralvinella palmiformis]|uniref:Secreted protein n=1 Tax=Paralvinella palmiformis TaxID=53620 RepID=A0AAD9MU29_9ANNE|nr:hypothetical protein LSH36_681g02050 [Paralvinella palmiformis]